MKKGGTSVAGLVVLLVRSLFVWSATSSSTRMFASCLALVGGRSGRTTATATSFIVTGANGFIGRAIVHELLLDHNNDEAENDDSEILCLVRPHRVASEQEYWNKQQQQKSHNNSNNNNIRLKVLPYDMLDGGATLRQALEQSSSTRTKKCVNAVVCYHVASVFGPTDNHKQTALDNVQGVQDLVRTLAEFKRTRNGDQMNDDDDGGSCCCLVLTSSMAAVRASGQAPLNAVYYTEQDWNTQSELGANWGASYQWSKAESERCAWESCRKLDLPMASLCPSFVFGPPYGYNNDDKSSSSSSSSYSLTLVGEWVQGQSPVQSRLFVDARDVAQAHVAAGKLLLLQQQEQQQQQMQQQDDETSLPSRNRFIVSTESRVPSREIAEWLQEVVGKQETDNNPSSSAIIWDSDYQGGAIPIGQKEVQAAERLERELGITLRPVRETITDMAQALLKQQQQETTKS